MIIGFIGLKNKNIKFSTDWIYLYGYIEGVSDGNRNYI